MRLLLITASAPGIRRVRKSRVLNFQQITMPYLAAYVPAHWHVEHVDEHVRPVNLAAEADLVGITFHTPSAEHAYAIAAGFRARGIPVALGGPHVSLLPEEAAQHADVIFCGEAEETWPAFLRDFECGEQRSIYAAAHTPDLAHVPRARRDLFQRHDHTGGVVFASRGCPQACAFCTLAVMYRRQVRHRCVAEVAAEVASFAGKVIIFWDDNLAADLTYAKELFRALIPLRKWWSSQASVHAGQDEEFLELAARSGCKQLFLGFESLSQSSLDFVHKRFNRVDEYAHLIERIHAHGIAVQAGIVFGFDGDTPDIFEETLDFLEENGVQNATFNVLTPYPGTALYRQLEAEGRLLTREWSKYNSRSDVVFQPKNMSPTELLAGFRAANERFYSVGSVLRRLSRSPVGLWWALPLNLAYCLAWRRTRDISSAEEGAPP
jgi:radical SAM superfamily enzyme YgiQ (UPF0313 family)